MCTSNVGWADGCCAAHYPAAKRCVHALPPAARCCGCWHQMACLHELRHPLQCAYGNWLHPCALRSSHGSVMVITMVVQVLRCQRAQGGWTEGCHFSVPPGRRLQCSYSLHALPLKVAPHCRHCRLHLLHLRWLLVPFCPLHIAGPLLWGGTGMALGGQRSLAVKWLGLHSVAASRLVLRQLTMEEKASGHCGDRTQRRRRAAPRGVASLVRRY